MIFNISPNSKEVLLRMDSVEHKFRGALVLNSGRFLGPLPKDSDTGICIFYQQPQLILYLWSLKHTWEGLVRWFSCRLYFKPFTFGLGTLYEDSELHGVRDPRGQNHLCSLFPSQAYPEQPCWIPAYSLSACGRHCTWHSKYIFSFNLYINPTI